MGDREGLLDREGVLEVRGLPLRVPNRELDTKEDTVGGSAVPVPPPPSLAVPTALAAGEEL